MTFTSLPSKMKKVVHCTVCPFSPSPVASSPRHSHCNESPIQMFLLLAQKLGHCEIGTKTFRTLGKFPFTLFNPFYALSYFLRKLHWVSRYDLSFNPGFNPACFLLFFISVSQSCLNLFWSVFPLLPHFAFRISVYKISFVFRSCQSPILTTYSNKLADLKLQKRKLELTLF